MALANKTQELKWEITANRSNNANPNYTKSDDTFCIYICLIEIEYSSYISPK